ncbi:MAG TPA: mechanosensitive ion channel domain-containing protein [Actinomycetota bacterium]
MTYVASVAVAEDLKVFSGEWWVRFALGVGVALVIAVVASWIVHHYVRRYRRRAASSGDDPSGRRRRRLATAVGLAGGVIIVIAWSVVVLSLVSFFGVALGPLIASAGIAGLAIGFGAQQLVADTISGLFLVLEGQFDVGDSVQLETDGGQIAGTVERLSLRATAIREFDGTLSTVSNGLIQITRNKTRGWGRAIVDLRIALDEDPEKVRVLIEALLHDLANVEPYASGLREEPKVLGVTQLTENAQVIRVTAETEPSKRVDVERAMRQSIAGRLNAEGIRRPPPYPPMPSGTV